MFDILLKTAIVHISQLNRPAVNYFQSYQKGRKLPHMVTLDNVSVTVILPFYSFGHSFVHSHNQKTSISNGF